MKKFRLDIDELRVESFEAALAGGPRAGVRAHEAPTEDNPCRVDVCGGNYPGSDQGTCAYSCNSDPCWCIPQG
jgi:hypothetical protein